LIMNYDNLYSRVIRLRSQSKALVWFNIIVKQLIARALLMFVR